MRKFISKIIVITIVFVFNSTIFSFTGEQGNPVIIYSTFINDGSINVDLKPFIVINFSKKVRR